MQAVAKFFNRHHDFLIKYGGAITLMFLLVYIPCSIAFTQQSEKKRHAAVEAELQAKLIELNENLAFYELDYRAQQAKLQEVDCLAKNIYFEAASEPYDGKLAVAEVTMNRVHSGFANSVCGVVKQKLGKTCQFSWYCEPKRAITETSAWSDSQSIAKNILLKNKKYGIIGDAKYFHANYVNPEWANTKRFKKQIGNHLFYR